MTDQTGAADAASTAGPLQIQHDILIDVNPRAPALSATSDMPIPKEAGPPLSAVGSKAGAEVAIDPPAGEETAQETEVVAEPAAEPKPAKGAKPGLQERISDLTNARKAETARAEAAEAQATANAKALADATAALKALAEAKPEEPPAPRPQRDKFDSPEAYDEALMAYAADQAAKTTKANIERDQIEARAAETQKATEQRVAAETAAIQKSWNDKRTAAETKYPDYAEVAEADTVQISVPMAHAIMQSDAGADVAYYLGKHPELATKIAEMTAFDPTVPGSANKASIRAAIEIGKIEAKLAAPAATVTRAPAPIRTLGAQQTAVSKEPAEMSMDEYAAYKASKRLAAHHEKHGLRAN